MTTMEQKSNMLKKRCRHSTPRLEINRTMRAVTSNSSPFLFLTPSQNVHGNKRTKKQEKS